MTIKRCTKCKEEKSIGEFSLILNRGKRVRSARCNECVSAYKRQHYQKNRKKYLEKSRQQRLKDPDAYKQYMKEYWKKNKDRLRESGRQYARSERGRELNRIRSSTYRASPEGKYKDRVRSEVAYAIKVGKIVRPDKCESCGKKKARVEAHHEDYSKPLKVKWLCKLCHEYVHHLNEGHESSEVTAIKLSDGRVHEGIV